MPLTENQSLYLYLQNILYNVIILFNFQKYKNIRAWILKILGEKVGYLFNLFVTKLISNIHLIFYIYCVAANRIIIQDHHRLNMNALKAILKYHASKPYVLLNYVFAILLYIYFPLSFLFLLKSEKVGS